MAVCNDQIEALNNAFSGFGVDEKSLISILGKWKADEAESFRKGAKFFIEDDHHRLFNRWDQQFLEQLRQEFLRFKNAVVLWTMHPWERDARLMKDALMDGPKSYNVVIELTCSRSSEELLGARRAYHSLFHCSIEEDVVRYVNAPECKLLLALVSSYRYEGPRGVHEEAAKSEALTLFDAIINGNKKIPIEDDEVVRILSTRSKAHLNQVFKYYKLKVSGKNIEEDLVDNASLKYTMQCLSTPEAYFVKVLDEALDPCSDENSKEGLIRVIVTRADTDLKVINEEYYKQNGVTLTEKIERTANGNFKDLLLTLLARAG